jgi:murein DD-endopeptidase MepM/ murein hydrolase activator NlpD
MSRAILIWLGIALLGALGACASQRPIYPVGHVMPMEAPPAPRRKPEPPAGFYALAAGSPAVQSGAAQSNQPAIEVEPLAPAPAQEAVRTPTPTPAPSPADTRPVAGRYKVQLGDTLYAVSRRTGVPIRALIDANDLEPPYALSAGGELTIPNPKLHRVRPGETVYGISRAYGVEMSELVRLNAIDPPYTIAVGAPLVLPGSSAPPDASAALAQAEPAPEPAVETSPRNSTVAEASAPASTGSVPQEEGGVPKPRPKPSTGTTAEAPAVPAPARKPSPSTSQVAASTAPAAANLPVPNPPARAGGKFLWPVPGKVVGKFGPQGSGRHNDGINILAPRGTPVRAAENGVVVYAGEQLKGFGRLLLVKHADSWITAYAHNDTLLVGRGQTVQRGQPIARVGSSGNVASPQLHFEIRKGKRAVDPVRVLGKNPLQSSG